MRKGEKCRKHFLKNSLKIRKKASKKLQFLHRKIAHKPSLKIVLISQKDKKSQKSIFFGQILCYYNGKHFYLYLFIIFRREYGKS